MNDIILLKNEIEYKIYFNNYIVNNIHSFLEDINTAHRRFDIVFPNRSPTWHYRYYNIFSLTFGSLHFYKLFHQLKYIIKEHNKIEEPLWFMAWMNYHKPHELLDWHNHSQSKFHGFISFDPKNTKTLFQNYEIDNEPGKIYIGNSSNYHKVVALEPYNGLRTTLAFDVYDYKHYQNAVELYKDDLNISVFPI
jgi:hypothetical protein